MKKVIGHYEILEKLGEGGMGVVYKARDLRLQRIVALKVLAEDKARAADYADRFVREARTASGLNHPNIVTIHDVDFADGVPVIAMEYVSGKRLADLIEPGGLPLGQALQYALQLADALATAHAAGIIHRDLKPINVMINDAGVLKVLDFGLAKRFAIEGHGSDSTVEAAVTQPGVVVGTVPYMSPEQAAGDRIDTRSDVFSFGAVLYEMLTGIRPFAGENTRATLHKIHFENPPLASSLRKDIPSSVDAILAKALVKRQEGRFQDFQDIRTALQNALDELSSRSAPAKGKRGRILAALAILVAIEVGLAMFLVKWPARDGRNNSSIAQVDPATAPSSALTPIEWTTRGLAWMDRYDVPENIDRAIAAYKKALERNPNHAAAYAALTRAYLAKNGATPDPQWIKLANESSETAVKLNPELGAGHLARAGLLQTTGQIDAAERELKTTLDLDPLSADAHSALGEIYAAKDKTKAEEFFKHALQLNPGQWNTYQFYGRFLYRNARYEEAAAIWQQGARQAPDNILLLRNLGAAYHMLDRYDDAASAFQRALEIMPSATIYNNLGTARFFQGRYAQAVGNFEKAVEMNPTFYLYWGNLGDARRWTSNSEKKAREAYDRAVALAEERLKTQPGDPELTASLAVYLAKSGARDRAIKILDNMNTLPKRSPGSYFKAAVAYEVSGRRDDSLRALQAAVAAGYSLKEVKNESEFTKLRTDRRYHEMLETLSTSPR
jgi:serine/threonine-protein kinase